MIRRLPLLIYMLAFSCCLAEATGEYRHLDLPTSSEVTVASFDYVADVPLRDARAVVVLVPGCNGDGTAMLKDAAWREFALTNRFVLGAFTFQSEVSKLENEGGYYDTALGSGMLAVSAFKKLGVGRKIPVVMYGFSGGAHFTSSFADRYPEWVKGWCAASFSQKSKSELNTSVDSGRSPPGVVACGEGDRRVGRAVSYYNRGRELDRRWTWVEIPGLVHERSPEIERFVRSWFAALLLEKKSAGVWVDLGSGEIVDRPDAQFKTLRTWLPSKALHAEWLKINRKRTINVVRHKITLKNDVPPLTMFLKKPQNDVLPQGVLCLCMLANSADEVQQRLETGKGGLFDWALSRNFAIVAWGSRGLWDANSNWDDLPREKARAIDAAFDQIASGWNRGIKWFEKEHGLPSSGYLMSGSCGAGQFVQRLALRHPERFLAVHMNIPGSFDKPTKKGASVLWCLTTGERLEGGYDRSLKFFTSVRESYPIVYKAYPGVSHTVSSPARSGALGRACFDFALLEYERATKLNGGKPTRPDWEEIFASASHVADIKNQSVFPVVDYLCVPNEFRMLLPDELRAEWIRE